MLTTLVITVITVGVELVIGFALAMVMHRAIFGRRTVRTAILLPYGIVTVISAFAWKYAFDVQSGFVNSWFGLGDFAWFSDRWAALFVIILSEIWKTTPFVSLLLLAGLAQVPRDLGEAATVDGATAWQRLKRVTIPNMKAAILVAVLFRTLDAWRIFDNVFIMTAGQEKTQVLSFLTYQQIITRTELGLGNAVGVLLFLSVVLIAALFIKGSGWTCPKCEVTADGDGTFEVAVDVGAVDRQVSEERLGCGDQEQAGHDEGSGWDPGGEPGREDGSGEGEECARRDREAGRRRSEAHDPLQVQDEEEALAADDRHERGDRDGGDRQGAAGERRQRDERVR